MSKKPPIRPGITFEVGARVEAQDYLQKWYTSRIEEVDHEEGKLLVHFDRWSHRYDEWIFWDSSRLRPLEKAALCKAGLKEEDMAERLGEMRTSRLRELPGCTESTEDQTELPQPRQELRGGEEVLARWTDCRYYPAKIETVNKEGTYTVQFYDGVIRCVKRIHIKSMPEDAKGQDWIALVKEAAVTAKSKGVSKPRTSANSNKDRDDPRGERSDEETDEELDEEPDSEKLVSAESPAEEEPKASLEQQDLMKVKRKNNRLPTSCCSKRARRSGCHDDGPESTEEQRDAPPTLPQSVEEPDSRPPPPSSPRRLKHHSGEWDGSQRAPRLCPGPGCAGAPESVPSPSPGLSGPDAALPGPLVPVPPGSPRTSELGQRRRRSQRLATYVPEVTFDPVPTSPSSPHDKDLSVNPSQTDCALSEKQDTNSMEKSEPTLHNYCLGEPPMLPSTPFDPAPSRHPVTESDKLIDGPTANHTAVAHNQKAVGRTPKPNRHAREPIMNTKRSDDPSSPNEGLIDLDHNKFKCRVPGCSKAFRKAKLLDYHLKYYHSGEKELAGEPGSPGGSGRTRATSASMPTSTLLEVPDSRRRRTVSSSSSLSPQGHSFPLDCAGSCLKAPKFGKKKRSSASVSSDTTEVSLPPPTPEKSFKSLHDKILKKVIEKDKHLEPGLLKADKRLKPEERSQLIGKRRDKERKEQKEKDPFKMKQKKKKKKKKKSKQHCYSHFEEASLGFTERSASPLNRSSSGVFSLHGSSAPKHQYPRAILSVDLTGENLSDVDFLEDSTTESLLLSGDEYNQDFESLTMEDFQEEEDGTQEIVRCVCEMDEENGFMIQCEECLCWQHSMCMGLLEDSIPDQYICYICRDPPGQRWSARYRHDREWLTKGHMYGLSFLADNYSHQNAKKIVSTHQLLADAYSVNKILHGLQLKMDILQNKPNPDLHLWARSWVNSDEDQPMGGLPDCIHFKGRLADPLNQNPDTYITSEHSYQKPPGPDHWPSVDTRTSSRSEWTEAAPHAVPFGLKEEEERTSISGPENRPGSVEQARSCLQWQMNLLTHIEDIQNQVAGRMDLIEKELDELESWLDFTGELEPPDPLARLPQLKCRIKQLLADLGKVQQMSTLCSV